MRFKKKVGKGLKVVDKKEAATPKPWKPLWQVDIWEEVWVRGNVTVRGKWWEHLTWHPWYVEICFGMLDEQVGQWGWNRGERRTRGVYGSQRAFYLGLQTLASSRNMGRYVWAFKYTVSSLTTDSQWHCVWSSITSDNCWQNGPMDCQSP